MPLLMQPDSSSALTTGATELTMLEVRRASPSDPDQNASLLLSAPSHRPEHVPTTHVCRPPYCVGTGAPWKHRKTCGNQFSSNLEKGGGVGIAEALRSRPSVLRLTAKHHLVSCGVFPPETEMIFPLCLAPYIMCMHGALQT